jgi:hypothetical protein
MKRFERASKFLKEEMEAGRVKIFADLQPVLSSIKAVRYGSDGKVDLSTVDSRVRSLANMVSHFRYRREAIGLVTLGLMAPLQVGCNACCAG